MGVLKMDLCGKIGSENHLISQELLQLVAQLNILSTNNLEVLSLGELIAQIEQFNMQNDETTEHLSSTSNKLTADIEGAKEKKTNLDNEIEDLSSKSVKSESELIGLQNSNKTLDLDRVILRKSREIQISKLKELRDEAEKMQEDQAECDEVETQLKQDIENTRIRIAAETRAQIEKIEKLRKQIMKITDENLNLLSDVDKIGASTKQKLQNI